MFNDILNDIWNNYRGRLLCSVFGLFIGVVVLWLGFFQALFLMICIGVSRTRATSSRACASLSFTPSSMTYSKVTKSRGARSR